MQSEHLASALIVYSCLILLCILLAIAAHNDKRHRIPQVDFPWPEYGFMELLSYIALYMMIGSLIFAGLVDVIIWSRQSHDPSVSDLIHYYLNCYPWVGWVVAGIVYHLLIDRPAPPRG